MIKYYICIFKLIVLFHYENSSGEISIKDILNLQLKKSKQTKLGPLLQKYVMEIEITRTRRVMKKTTQGQHY